MIQRKQTLYLLSISILCAVMLIADMKISRGSSNVPGSRVSYEFSVSESAIQPQNISGINYGMFISLITIFLVSTLAIFAYRNRSLQLKLVSFNFLLLGLTVFFMTYGHVRIVSEMGESVTSELFYIAWIMPVLMAAFNILSFRGIRKDIDLIASVDRLR